jgi:uracil-DNA glycosylase family 4
MKDQTQKIWQALNLLEDLIRHGERTGHPPAPLPRAATNATPRSARSERSPVATRGESGRSAHDDQALRLGRLAAIAERVRRCTRCALAEGRMNAVPGEGVLDPLVMVIGEGPGADEDRRGIPFVGRAGQYLDKWLEAIDVSRDKSAFIGNIVKCRPPGNRDPKLSESDACIPYLREQIELIRPRTILSVGRIASGLLIGTGAGIGSLRGRTYYYDGIPLIPTYHPSGVLRNPDLRRPVWDDLKRLVALLETLKGCASGPAANFATISPAASAESDIE